MSKLILLFAAFQYSASASFLETSRRYLSAKDMFTVMAQKFPVLNNPLQVEKLNPTCWVVGQSNMNITGQVVPAIGVPAASQPGAGFVRWWASCAEKILNMQFKELEAKPADAKLWRRYWAPDVLDRFTDKNSPDSPFHKLATAKWANVIPKVRDDQVAFLIEEWIGPNAVIKDLGFAKGTNELAGILKGALDPASDLTFEQANQKLLLALMLREEFITY